MVDPESPYVIDPGKARVIEGLSGDGIYQVKNEQNFIEDVKPSKLPIKLLQSGTCSQTARPLCYGDLVYFRTEGDPFKAYPGTVIGVGRRAILVKVEDKRSSFYAVVMSSDVAYTNGCSLGEEICANDMVQLQFSVQDNRVMRIVVGFFPVENLIVVNSDPDPSTLSAFLQRTEHPVAGWIVKYATERSRQ